MFMIDTSVLNAAERNVLDALTNHARLNPAPTITQAASICGCSSSFISKTVRKAGFGGYRQYLNILYFGEIPGTDERSDELERLKIVIDTFDLSLVDEFVELINRHAKILLFGYGPSRICAEYFEYKLRLSMNSFIATPSDEASVRNMAGPGSMLVIITTTGRYRSFREIYLEAKSKGADVIIISEEFNAGLMTCCDRCLVLTRCHQPETLLPHEKTRTVFFIFFELVIRRLLERFGDPPE